MVALDKATKALRELEPRLREPTRGGIHSLELSDQVHAVRALLSKQEPRWIGIAKARRLLGHDSEKYVKAWIEMGLLRSRRLPRGTTQVLLDDVLLRREEREGLSAIDGDEPISTEEALQLLRPKTYGYPRRLKTPTP